MLEKAYFLLLGDERIFVFLHSPDGPSRGGILLCAPLGEEKLWAHRVLVSFARRLCAIGYSVLRFDYRGEGDSDRAFEESSLASRLDDTRCAIEELRRQLPKDAHLTLAGLRLGASIAALAAAGRSDVGRLLLWDPVTDGAEYMQAVLRSNLMLQMAQHRRVVENRESLVERMNRGELVNVEGYMLSGEFFREVSAIRLAAARPESSVRTLIVSIGTGDSPAREQHVDLGKAWPNSKVATAVEEPFWREIRSFYGRAQHLFGLSVGWLDDTA